MYDFRGLEVEFRSDSINWSQTPFYTLKNLVLSDICFVIGQIPQRTYVKRKTPITGACIFNNELNRIFNLF